jgi:hypothetical protein
MGGIANVGPLINSVIRPNARQPAGATVEKDIVMLYTIVVVLLILWLLGLVSSYTLGGFIHVLLVLAIVVILLRIISGKKPL